MNWFILALKNTLDFKGRARRKEFGWFTLGSFIISFLFGFLEISAESLGMIDLALVFSLISSLISILLIVPSLSVTARRLHDLGYSGWWQLLGLLLAITVIGYIAFILWLIFKDGQPDANKYGESPKQAKLTNKQAIVSP